MGREEFDREVADGAIFAGSPETVAAKIVRTGTGKVGTDGHLRSFRRIASMRAATSSGFSAPFSYRRFAVACAARSK